MTYQDVLTFAQTAQGWLSTKPAESKLTYAVGKMLQRLKPLIESYHEQVEDLSITFAAEKDGVLQRDANGQLAYTKEHMQKRVAAIRALARSEVTITPHLVEAIPPECGLALIDAFTGFVFAAKAEPHAMPYLPDPQPIIKA